MSRRTQQHVTGQYRRGTPPPDRRELPEKRLRRPGCALIVGLLLAVASAALTAVVAMLLLFRPAEPAGGNAIWLGISWGEELHTDEEVESLADLLRVQGVDVVYVWTTWLQEDDTWSETTFANLAAFVDQFKRYYPQARLDAWIGLPVDAPEYRIDDAEIRAQVAAFAAQAITDFDFDGVHLNAEPVWDGDEHYVQLLRDVRQALADEVTLSIAVPPDWNTGQPGIPVGPYTTPDAFWSQEYKQRVAFIVDEIAVMSYNSGLSSPLDYQTWMAFQVTRFTAAVASLDVETALVFGIPTYDAELPGHDPVAESVQAAIGGIVQGIAQSADAADRVRGVGVYAYWSTGPEEWAAYRELWLNRADR
jgi:hypothetical protein